MLPHAGVTLYLSVGLHEDTVIPGIPLAAVRDRAVIRAEIADDAGASRIGGADRRLAAQKPMRLIKIRSPGHVRRYDSIIVKNGDAVHLHDEEYGYACPSPVFVPG